VSGELLLGLDLGTTGVRALAVGPDGRVRGRAYQRLATRFPAPGRVEQDPESWIAQSREVLRAALAEARAGARDVAALGIATQRATALAWDAADARPLAPALGWQDRRAEELGSLFSERGLPPLLQPSLAKFVWWLEREPAVRDAARAGRLRLGTPDAWLARRLTGEPLHVTDPGQASCTALYDLARRDWSPVLLARAGLARETLPAVVASAGIVGETASELLGAPVPLAARAGDQQAAAFAQGVHAEGEAKLTLGTAAMLELHTGAAPAAGKGGAFPLALWRLRDGGEAFCLEASVHTAGAAVDWWVALGVFPDAAALARAADVAASDGVVFVPALAGLGAPWHDAGARGFVGGLTRGSGRAALARATLEGVAQRCADLIEALAPPGGPLRVDGGLAQSALLLELVADASRRPLERAAETDTSALGAALLAGLGIGALADLDACRALRPACERFEPGPDAAAARAARSRWRARLARARSER
jgi:glycerol kinase